MKIIILPKRFRQTVISKYKIASLLKTHLYFTHINIAYLIGILPSFLYKYSGYCTWDNFNCTECWTSQTRNQRPGRYSESSKVYSWVLRTINI